MTSIVIKIKIVNLLAITYITKIILVKGIIRLSDEELILCNS